MIFSGTVLSLSILVLMVPTSPEFVVHELMACCHHQVKLQCPDPGSRIGIIQARYMVPGSENKYLESLAQHPWLQKQPSHNNSGKTYSHSNYVSLWDMDVTFIHELLHSTYKPADLNEPEWMRSPVSKFPRYIPPRQIPDGFNFTQDKLLEMPYYDKSFLDRNTIWTQPLFPLQYQKNHTSSHKYTDSGQMNRDDEYFPRCLSYEALLRRGGSWSKATSASVRLNILMRRRQEQEAGKKQKPSWHYTDLRPVFNQRCSGRPVCSVDLLKNKLHDEDLTRVCNRWPDGRIVVKYLCYDTKSRQVHSQCNENMSKEREGFILNPGYPNVYPGDFTCQWKLQVEEKQRILLVLLDVSVRGQEKSGCLDELTITEDRTKILSTCGDHKSAIAVLSFSSFLNVTFHTRSRLAFPKRGFIIYFRALGCVQPSQSQITNSYISQRNASHLHVHCDAGHLFADTFKNARWLLCDSLENRWIGGELHCEDIEIIMATNGTNIRPVLDKDSQDVVISDYVIPVAIMLVLFICNGFVLLWIRKKKERLASQLENQENELEEIIKTEAAVVTTPEESTYTLSSDGTDLLTGPNTKKTWTLEVGDENVLEPIGIVGVNNVKNSNGGIIYNAVPTATNGGFYYGFPRSTPV